MIFTSDVQSGGGIIFWVLFDFSFKEGASEKETQVFRDRDKSQGISNGWYLEQSSVYTFAFK